jgi:hypothetical protein
MAWLAASFVSVNWLRLPYIFWSFCLTWAESSRLPGRSSRLSRAVVEFKDVSEFRRRVLVIKYTVQRSIWTNQYEQKCVGLWKETELQLYSYMLMLLIIYLRRGWWSSKDGESTVSQAYFALHETLHKVQNIQEKILFGIKVTSKAFLNISQNLKVDHTSSGRHTNETLNLLTKLWSFKVIWTFFCGSFMALLCSSKWSDKKCCETDRVALKQTFKQDQCELFKPIFLQDTHF